MKKIFCLLFICHASFGFAQIDSLKQCLTVASGKEKVKILNRLTALDSSSFRNYHMQALLLTKELNDNSGKVHALCAMGDHYYDRSLPDSAYPYYAKGLNEARKYKLQSEIIMCLDKSAMVMEYNSHYDQALVFYNEAVAESKKLKDNKEISRALDHLGLFHLYQRNDSVAIKCFTEQLEIAKQLNDSNVIYICLNNIGAVYYYRSEYANAIQYYENSLKIEEKLHKDTAIAESHHNIGIAYKNQGNYEIALKNLLSAARFLKKLKPSQGLGSCYNSIGAIYIEIGETEKALFYHYQALEVRKKINNKRGIASSYTSIGETYKVQGEYGLALNFINESIKLKEELKDKGGLATSVEILGEIYFLKKDFVQAENYYLQSMKLRQEVEDPKGKATTLNKMGALYFEWKKYDLAIQKLEEARTIATTIGAKAFLLDNYETTIKVLRNKGDFSKALLYFDEYIALKDEVLSEQKNKALTEMQVKYETDEKDQQLILMDEKDKSQAAILSQQYTLIVALTAGTLLLILIVVISYRSGVKSNKQNKIIIGQKQMMIEQKQVVMKELHHRVKNNLQVLSSLLDLQQRRLEDPSTKDAIKAVEHRLNAMLLIHQDLYGDSVDSEVNMNEYIKKLVDNLLFSFGYSNGKMKINLFADILFLDADKALNIGFICNEVISNSLKHAFATTDHPELTITLKKKNEHLLFMLADNGRGMPVERDIEKTNSFGLRLIHMFVKDLLGSITIVSNNAGSSFEFIIPIK